MNLIRLFFSLLVFALVIVPILAAAAICCDGSEQIEIGEGLFLIVRAIGGRKKPSEPEQPPVVNDCGCCPESDAMTITIGPIEQHQPHGRN